MPNEAQRPAPSNWNCVNSRLSQGSRPDSVLHSRPSVRPSRVEGNYFQRHFSRTHRCRASFHHRFLWPLKQATLASLGKGAPSAKLVLPLKLLSVSYKKRLPRSEARVGLCPPLWCPILGRSLRRDAALSSSPLDHLSFILFHGRALPCPARAHHNKHIERIRKQRRACLTPSRCYPPRKLIANYPSLSRWVLHKEALGLDGELNLDAAL